MRTGARALITVATMGVLAASYQFGTAAQTGLILGMPTAAPVETAPVSAPAEAAPSANAPVSTAPSASSSASAPAATSSPTKAPTATPTKAPVAAAKTATGAAIEYKYGTVQLKVTKASGAITDVSVLVGFGSEPKYTDLINSLAQYAVAANGSNFGNVSRATLTTTAFKQALDSAIAKL